MSRNNIRRLRRNANPYLTNLLYGNYDPEVDNEKYWGGNGISVNGMGSGNPAAAPLADSSYGTARVDRNKTVSRYVRNNSNLAQRLGLVEAGVVSLAGAVIDQDQRIDQIEQRLGMPTITPFNSGLNNLQALQSLAPLVAGGSGPLVPAPIIGPVSIDRVTRNSVATLPRSNLPAAQRDLTTNWWEAIQSLWNNYNIPSHPWNLNNGSALWDSLGDWWTNSSSQYYPTNYSSADAWWLALNSWWNNSQNNAALIPGANAWWTVIQAWWRMIMALFNGNGINNWRWDDAQRWWGNQMRFWPVGPQNQWWNDQALGWWNNQYNWWWNNNGCSRWWDRRFPGYCRDLWWNNPYSWWNNDNWCCNDWNCDWRPCGFGGCSFYGPCGSCVQGRCWDRNYWNRGSCGGFGGGFGGCGPYGYGGYGGCGPYGYGGGLGGSCGPCGFDSYGAFGGCGSGCCGGCSGNRCFGRCGSNSCCWQKKILDVEKCNIWTNENKMYCNDEYSHGRPLFGPKLSARCDKEDMAFGRSRYDDHEDKAIGRRQDHDEYDSCRTTINDGSCEMMSENIFSTMERRCDEYPIVDRCSNPCDEVCDYEDKCCEDKCCEEKTDCKCSICVPIVTVTFPASTCKPEPKCCPVETQSLDFGENCSNFGRQCPPCEPCNPCNPCNPCEPCEPCNPCEPCEPCEPCIEFKYFPVKTKPKCDESTNIHLLARHDDAHIFKTNIPENIHTMSQDFHTSPEIFYAQKPSVPDHAMWGSYVEDPFATPALTPMANIHTLSNENFQHTPRNDWEEMARRLPDALKQTKNFEPTNIHQTPVRNMQQQESYPVRQTEALGVTDQTVMGQRRNIEINPINYVEPTSSENHLSYTHMEVAADELNYDFGQAFNDLTQLYEGVREPQSDNQAAFTIPDELPFLGPEYVELQGFNTQTPATTIITETNCSQKFCEFSPKPDGCSPELEQFPPKPDGCSQKFCEFSPKLESCSPELEQFPPKLESCSPELEQFLPKSGNCSPRVEQCQEVYEIVQPAATVATNSKVVWSTKISPSGSSGSNALNLGGIAGNADSYFTLTYENFNTQEENGAEINVLTVNKYTASTNVHVWSRKVTSASEIKGVSIKTYKNTVIVLGTYTANINIYNECHEIISTLRWTGIVNTFILAYDGCGSILWSTGVVANNSVNQAYILPTDMDIATETGAIAITGYVSANSGIIDFMGLHGITASQLPAQTVAYQFVAKYDISGLVLWVSQILDISPPTNLQTIGFAVKISPNGKNLYSVGLASSAAKIYNAQLLSAPVISNIQPTTYTGITLIELMVLWSAGIAQWCTFVTGFTQNQGVALVLTSNQNLSLIVPFQGAEMKIYNTPNATVDAGFTLTGPAVAIVTYNMNGVTLSRTKVVLGLPNLNSGAAVSDSDDTFVVALINSTPSTAIQVYKPTGVIDFKLVAPTDIGLIKFNASTSEPIWGAGTTISQNGTISNVVLAFSNQFITLAGNFNGGPIVFKNSDGTVGSTVATSNGLDIFVARYLSYGQVVDLDRGSCVGLCKCFVIKGWANYNTFIRIPDHIVVEEHDACTNFRRRVKEIFLISQSSCFTICWTWQNRWNLVSHNNVVISYR
jgi:hypothetical protein